MNKRKHRPDRTKRTSPQEPAPAGPAVSHSSRRLKRYGGVLLIVALLAVTCSLLASNLTLKHAWRTALAELNLVRADQATQFAHVEKLMGAIGFEYEYLEKPRDFMLREYLVNVRGVLDRYLGQSIISDPDATLSRARMYVTRAQVNEELGQVGRIEEDLRTAKRLLEQLGGQSSRADVPALMADVENRTACLLARQGRFDEAERYVSSAIGLSSAMDRLAGVGTGHQQQLASFYRNRALILAGQGHDATTDLQRSVELVIGSLAATEQRVPKLEFLIDSYQLVAQFLWQAGHIELAEKALDQSIESIDSLLAIGLAVSETGHVFSRQKYDSARRLAEANRQRVRGDESANSAGLTSWQWRPILRDAGTLLQADLLVRGRLPGEFERQEAMVLTWLDDQYSKDVVTRIISEIHRHVPVILLTSDDLMEADARACLPTAGVPLDAIRFTQIDTDTLWLRDFGPFAVETADGYFHWIDIRLQRDQQGSDRYGDDHVPVALARLHNRPLTVAPLYLEGGGLLSNGAGLCLVSRVMMERSKMLGYSEQQFHETIKRLFGARHVVLLDALQREPTGHVDWFAAFVSQDTVVIGDYRGRDPVNDRRLDEYAERLAGIETPSGPLQVMRIPMPPPQQNDFGGSYTNVVFANGVLLVPRWASAPKELETAAFETYRKLLPDWTVVGIDCETLGRRDGALRCATMNLAGPVLDSDPN